MTPNSTQVNFDPLNPTDWEKSTYYSRDAQGNVMAIYEYTVVDSTQQNNYTLTERNIYGSNRLGNNHKTVEMIAAPPVDTSKYEHYVGYRQYELSNHLGNVRAVVSDLKESTLNGTTGAPEDFEPELKVINNLYAFGSNQPGRSFFDADGSGTFGFNGMLKDNEIKGESNSYDFGARIYDPRIGRFLSVDPLVKSYPSQSPYSFALNNPISLVDINGEGPGIPPGHSHVAGLYITNVVVILDGKRVDKRFDESTSTWYKTGVQMHKGNLTKSTKVSEVTLYVVFFSNKYGGSSPVYLDSEKGGESDGDDLEIINLKVEGILQYPRSTVDNSFRSDYGVTDDFINNSQDNDLDKEAEVESIEVNFQTTSDSFTKKQKKQISKRRSEIRKKLRNEFGSNVDIKFNLVTNSTTNRPIEIQSKNVKREVVGKHKQNYENAKDE